MVSKKEILTHLEKIADLMEFKGENAFKVNAFRGAAINIRRYPGSIEDAIMHNSLVEIKGIGKGIIPVIEEFVSSSTSSLFNELSSSLPEGTLKMFEIRGLGPKKLSRLVNEERITTIDMLRDAIRENKIAKIKGFGEKTQELLRDSIEKIFNAADKFLLHEIEHAAHEIEEGLLRDKSVIKFSRTGELRRIKEIGTSLEYVVFTKDSSSFLKSLNAEYTKTEIESGIVTFSTENIPVKIYVCADEKKFTQTLFSTTGSEDFLRFVQYTPGNETDERAIFNRLNMNYFPPEMRETESIPNLNGLPEENLVKREDFHGHFHFHTIYSDGVNTLAEMAKEAKYRGFTHSVVCDHSKSAFYAGGLTEDRIEQQKSEVLQLQNEGYSIYQGIESDILRSGELDYPEEILKEFTLVVASIHSATTLDEEEMTARIIKAVENPYTDILAHPTGRILLKRDPYSVNIKKVIDACVGNQVAIEINANPKRLDLDWRNIAYAREKGALFAINPDAHSTAQIEYVKYGINIARKGGVTSKEVINCLTLDEFKTFVNRKVRRSI